MADLPLRVTIPLPSEIPRGRGRHATGRFGTGIRVRITYEERLLIEQVIGNLDAEMTLSSFLRWCGVHAAQALQREMERTDEPDVQQRGERTDGGADGT